jgi:hypothetical protein
VCAALLVGAVVRAANAPLVSVQAHVEPAQPTIGERFRYVLEVAAPPGAEVVVTPPGEHLGDFDILDFGTAPPVERDGRTVTTRWWRLVGWSPGEHAIESPPVRSRQSGTELADVPGVTTPVVVASVLGDANEQADIRDIKGPEAVPPDRRLWYALAALAVLLALLGLVMRTLRARRGAQAAPPPPPRPAHEIAAEALRALRARRLPELGEFKEFYSALSSIVRRYLEDRFVVRAPEMTTEEFLDATARSTALEPGQRELLGDFLAESDLVKFARHVPTLSDSERVLGAAERFVEETAVRERLSAEEQRAAG